jgi:hemolysin activation/secretion protein
VRGYRENRLLKDSALLANVGLILNLSSADEGGVGVSAELFADYGRGENSEPALNVDTKGSLSSVGLALTAQYGGLTFELVKAHRFDDKEALGDTFQDEGIHVGVTYEF